MCLKFITTPILNPNNKKYICLKKIRHLNFKVCNNILKINSTIQSKTGYIKANIWDP